MDEIMSLHPFEFELFYYMAQGEIKEAQKEKDDLIRARGN